MTPEQQDLLEKAEKKLASAQVSLREGFPEDTASRAYYSMFYVAQSLLLGIDFTGKSHKGVISAFGEHLAMTGRVTRDFHRMLIDAEKVRRQADYGPSNAIIPEEAQRQIVRAEQFLELGNRLIVLPHYHRLYQKYVKQIFSQTPAQPLTQAEIDQGIATMALRENSLEEATLILQQSPLVQIHEGEYVQQILAQARSQESQIRDASSEDELEL